MKLAKLNPSTRPRRWTLTLLALGLVSAPAAMAGDEPVLRGVELYGGTTLSGYVDTSFLWALGTPPDAGEVAAFPNTIRLPGRLYDVPAKMNGFNLEAVSLVLDKPPGEEEWGSGYHVQLLMGPDVQLRNIWSLAGGGGGDIGLNEAYVTVRTPPGNGLEFRLGYFMSPLGYETFDSYRNPNYSRSYGYFIEPKAHTGLTVKYEFTEWFSAMAGIANNYSPFIDARTPEWNSPTWLGLLRFTGAGFGWPDATLTFGYTSGHTATSAPTDVSPRIHDFYAGLQVPLCVEGLSVGAAYDYQANFSAGWPAMFFFPEGPQSTYANATALYLNYAVNKWRFNTRVEYASASPGNGILTQRSAFGSDKPMFGANNEEFLGVTTTVSYQLWRNVLSRVEFRWDRDVSGGRPVFGTSAHPLRNSFTVGLNLIYLF